MVDRDLKVFGGVAVQSQRPADAEVVAVVRSGVERVVQTSMGIDLVWGTTACTPADDLSSRRSNTGRERLDWKFVEAKQREGRLESVRVGADSKAMVEAFDANPDFDLYDPHVSVAEVAARFPGVVPFREGPVGGVTAAVQMSAWSLAGAGESVLEVTAALTRWLLDSAQALDVDCGYVLVGHLPGGISGTSPYEIWACTHVSDRDLTRYLWGYGWGTLLSAHHVEAIGGISQLRGVGDVTTVGGGRVWVTLGADPATVEPVALSRLRAVLAPVLQPRSGFLTDEAHDPGPDWYLP